MIPSIKPGASIRGLRPEMVFAWMVWCRILDEFTQDVDPVLTEGTGGRHKPHSLHYVGQAMDLRSNTITHGLETIVETYQRALGPDFQVIIESRGSPNEHVHVEFQP